MDRPRERQATYHLSLDRDEPERVRSAFGDETYRRLRTIKAQYEPDNVFRLNHTIQPPDRPEMQTARLAGTRGASNQVGLGDPASGRVPNR